MKASSQPISFTFFSVLVFSASSSLLTPTHCLAEFEHASFRVLGFSSTVCRKPRASRANRPGAACPAAFGRGVKHTRTPCKRSSHCLERSHMRGAPDLS